MYSLIMVGVAGFVFSILTTPLVRNLFRRWGLVDHPDNTRKFHKLAIPRGGGIAIALAYGLSFAFLLSLPLHAGWIVEKGMSLTWRLLPAAILTLAVGLVDDIVSLRPWQKLLGQIAASSCAFLGGIHVSNIAGYHLGPGWSLLLTVGWLTFCTNALNLIDGIDGLATGLGLSAAATMLCAALLQSNVPLALATAPLVGALLGFLRYNFNPATIFLGDSGSLFLGFLLGCYGVIWSEKSATLLGMTAPLLALFVPLMDVALVVVRRFLRQQPLFKADRTHIHHRLLERGFTPRRAALCLYAAGVAGTICSIAVMQGQFSGIVVLLFSVFVVIGIWSLGYAEFEMALRMFREGMFRRQLNTRIALRHLEEKLAKAERFRDCWEAIRDAAPHFGVHCVRMKAGAHIFRSEHGGFPANYWTIRIPLSDDDHVELIHGFGGRLHADATAQFVEAVRKSLITRLAGFPVPAAEYTPVTPVYMDRTPSHSQPPGSVLSR